MADSDVVSVRLPRSLLAAVRAKAMAEDRTVTASIRLAVRRWVGQAGDDAELEAPAEADPYEGAKETPLPDGGGGGPKNFGGSEPKGRGNAPSDEEAKSQGPVHTELVHTQGQIARGEADTPETVAAKARQARSVADSAAQALGQADVSTTSDDKGSCIHPMFRRVGSLCAACGKQIGAKK